MKDISVFDIIGPIMIGPSSSHTAGALRIACVAGKLASGKIAKVHFKLYGSFSKTYRGHGTDRALVAGILGFDTGDYRIRDSFHLAQEAGIAYSFEEGDEQTGFHPNTVEITLTEESGTLHTLRGSSIGGGEIEIGEINGCVIEFSGKYNAFIIHQKDKPGVVAHFTKLFEDRKINIAYMRVYRESRGSDPFSIVEIDGDADESLAQEICRLPFILSAVYLRVN